MAIQYLSPNISITIVKNFQKVLEWKFPLNNSCNVWVIVNCQPINIEHVEPKIYERDNDWQLPLSKPIIDEQKLQHLIKQHLNNTPK